MANIDLNTNLGLIELILKLKLLKNTTFHIPKVLSTGVLNTVVGQTATHIEVANLGSTATRTVRVQVINWNSGSPVVLSNQTLTLPPKTHQIITTNVAPFHYEVRIAHPGDPNVIANTFAINAATFTLPGLTFNQDELMVIEEGLL